MAHGPAQRPIETKDGKPLDSEQSAGSKSLNVSDQRGHELLLEILDRQDRILLALEILIGEYVDETRS